VLDVSDPANPSPVGGYDVPTEADGIAVSGAWAYLGESGYGLVTLDVADPARPALDGHLRGEWYSRLAQRGDWVYGAAGWGGLTVVDVTDRGNPVKVGQYSTPELNAWQVAVAGGYAFVADRGREGLSIVDIRKPRQPAEVAFLAMPGNAENVAVDGCYAYVTMGQGGMHIVDVSDPVHPVEVGVYPAPWEVFDVAVRGNLAYVTDGSYGLHIVDIGDRESPVEVGWIQTPGPAPAIALGSASGGRVLAYIADGWDGLRVIDVSRPRHPVEIGNYDTPGWALDVAADGTNVYVADFDGGLYILRYALP
jgi:hypothetical protein